MRQRPVLASSLAAAVLLLAGCKSKPEKICANLEVIVTKEAPDKPLTAEDKARCVADVKNELEQCDNADTIANCYVEAQTLDAVATCQSKCAKKPSARPAASSSATPAAPRE